MVYYFTSNAVDPAAVIYMGKHKEENEELIKYGRDEDLWFHADKMSSAHVYLRLRPEQGDSFDNIPPKLLEDCAQLTKGNSIEGNKIDHVTVIYTPWANLKKTPGMETGQVAFHKENEMKKVYVEKRNNAIINRLHKTRFEKIADLRMEKIAHEKSKTKAQKEAERARKSADEKLVKQRQEEAALRSYDRVFNDEALRHSSNQGHPTQDGEFDFM